MLRFTSSCFLTRALPPAALAALLAAAAPLRADDSSLYGGVGYGAALLEDAEAAGVVVETDAVIDDVTWQVRGIDKQDDGRVTVLALAR